MGFFSAERRQEVRGLGKIYMDHDFSFFSCQKYESAVFD